MAAAAAEAALPSSKQPAPSAPARSQVAGGLVGPSLGGREVFGFVNAGRLGDTSVGYSSWNFSALSTVAFFGLHVNSSDGTLVNSDVGWSEWNSADLTGLLNTAHSRGVQVVVSVILQDFSPGTPAMCSGLAHAATTAGQVAAEVGQKGVDGVNVDYEGLNGSCGQTDPSWARHALTSFLQQLRMSMPGNYLSVDTYASSASDQGGFFDVPGLAQYSDSLFVMAYDLDRSNWSLPPLSCAAYCMNPTAPLAAYYWNDTAISAQYRTVVPASKVILGMPYYGYTDCAIGGPPPPANAQPASPANQQVPTYLNSVAAPSTSGVTMYALKRDVQDSAGQEPYSTWNSSTYNCWRESYWDDVTSLGHKYDLVNQDGLRGAGLFALDYGGGAPELWTLLRQKFSISRRPIAVLPALANGAYGGYTTSISLQNTGPGPASVAVRYFDQTGGAVGNGDNDPSLPSNAAWTIRQDNGSGLTSNTAGSGLVYSDQPLAAFVNEFAPGGGDATSYAAIQLPSASASTIFAPTIANGAFGGYTTGIGLVNLAGSAGNLNLTYRDSGGNLIKTQTINNLAAGAYHAVYSGDPALGLPAGFAGTATITSSAGAVAAVVNETGPGGQFSSYDAVPAGSTTLFAPAALNNAYGGYFTGMSIQNTTGSAGTVTVTYFDGVGSPTAKTFSLAAYGFLPIYQGSATDGPAPGAYTAKISSTVTIAAIVNEVAPATGPAQQSTAYNTFPVGMASLHLPLVENAGSDGWSTGEGIMNAGTASTTVTVSYFDTATGSPIGTPQSQLLQPNAFWGLYQPTGGLAAGTRATAVIATSPAGQVAVICNEANATTFMSYIGQ